MKEKTYSIESWNTYKKKHPLLSWGKHVSPNTLMEKGYKRMVSYDYSCIDVKSWKKIVEDYVHSLQKESDNYNYVDCVYYVYHSNQSYTFLDIYINNYNK